MADGPIVKELLDAGLTVHCPVRKPDDKEKLKYLTDIADASKGSIKFFKADLVDEESYLESTCRTLWMLTMTRACTIITVYITSIQSPICTGCDH